MSRWEKTGKSDEWYTQKYIFDALQCRFKMDVAAPEDRSQCNVPAETFITNNSLKKKWKGFIWCNPPFGGRNGIIPWVNKMIKHGNGILLTPDRTSNPWWQYTAIHSTNILFIDGKVKFIKPDGSKGKHPSTGTTLIAFGIEASEALKRARENGLGYTSI